MVPGTHETGDDKKRPSAQQESQRQNEELLEHHVELKNIFYDVLPSTQQMLMKVLTGQEWLESFYLVGGTALALQIGQRVSLDFALMKLSAIATRGAKKDFIDLYFLLQHFNLEELLTLFSIKYGEERDHHFHLLKSLVYFQDAENEPMPCMIQSVEWSDVRHFMVQKVKEIGFLL